MNAVGHAWDDEELLAALRHAHRARGAVPADFVRAAKDTFTWHSIDAELAQLTYDSFRELADATGTRTEAASIRSLTFSSANVAIELEVSDDALLGQIVPPQAGTLVVQTTAGRETSTTADEIGCFSIEPIPSGSFRLRCRTETGTVALTGWITL